MAESIAVFIVAHWLKITAVGVFGAVVGLWGVYAPQLLASLPDVGEMQPDLAGCDCDDCEAGEEPCR